MFEQSLIQLLSHAGLCHFFAVAYSVRIFHLVLFQPGVHVVRGLQMRVQQFIHRFNVHRHGHVLFNPFVGFHPCNHLVHVRNPCAKLGYVFIRFVIIGVKEVQSVLIHQDAVLIGVIVAISGDVIAFINDEHV